MCHLTKVNRFLQGLIMGIMGRRLEKTLDLITNMWQRLSDLLGSRVHLRRANEKKISDGWRGGASLRIQGGISWKVRN